MPRDSHIYLSDMLHAIAHIGAYIEGLEKESLIKDTMRFDAVIRNLEVLGEAAKGVSEEIREQHPEVPWREMSGFRDILIHQYFGIDVDIVWDVITSKLPELRNALEEINRAI